jgi:hypothetical protein
LTAQKTWRRFIVPIVPLLPVAAALILQHAFTLPIFWLGISIPLLVWLSLSLLPPTWFTIPVFALGGLLMGAVFLVNDMKISAVRMPVTALDLEQVMVSPSMLWRLVGLPDWIGLPALILVLAVIAIIVLWKALQLRSARWQQLVVYLAVALLVTQVIKTFVHSSESSATEEIKGRDDIWKNDGVVELYSSIGPVPFLVYSILLSKSFPAVILDKSIGASPPAAPQLEAVLREHLPFRKGELPNVVVMHLESMFNPDWAFKLNEPLNAGLFRRTKATKLLEPMRVNIVGGGSWVTEFEILTGLDARLFGYSGFYTHPNVSPMLTEGFGSYLKRFGYKTSAFYTTDGTFFNVQNAFKVYGIDNFRTPTELGVENGWYARDTTTAGAYVKFIGDNPEAPFFHFLSTNGAHSPYRCRHFRPEDDFKVRFLSADFHKNCILNEYILLLRDSRDAATEVILKLREIEARTGTPYVFLMYGDHQPHAFTGTGGLDAVDYSSERTDRSIKETFVHVFSSTTGDFGAFSAPLPAVLLPTLLSGFIAQDVQDTYLPINLYLHAKCGADGFASLQGPTKLGQAAAPASTKEAEISEDCRTAQFQAISAYRASGMLKQ